MEAVISLKIVTRIWFRFRYESCSPLCSFIVCTASFKLIYNGSSVGYWTLPLIRWSVGLVPGLKTGLCAGNVSVWGYDDGILRISSSIIAQTRVASISHVEVPTWVFGDSVDWYCFESNFGFEADFSGKADNHYGRLCGECEDKRLAGVSKKIGWRGAWFLKMSLR